MPAAFDVGRNTRRACAEDVPPLVALRRQMLRDMGAPDAGKPDWQDAARHWFAQRLSSPGVCLVVVEVQDSVVASAMGTLREAAPSPSSPRSGDVLISSVSTDPAHRRRGHARAAVQFVLEWAATLDVGRAELAATTQGQQLYLDAGFTPFPHPLFRRAL